MATDILNVDESPPEGVVVLSNGAWQSKETGKIVKAPPGPRWDSKKASEMAKRRWAKVREQTREGITAAVQKRIESENPYDPSLIVKDFPEAHGVVVETLMTDIVLNKKEKGNTRSGTYKTLLEIEGSVQRNRSQDGEQSPAMTITFSRDVAKYMMDRLMERERERSGDVVEAVFVEEEE